MDLDQYGVLDYKVEFGVFGVLKELKNPARGAIDFEH